MPEPEDKRDEDRPDEERASGDESTQQPSSADDTATGLTSEAADHPFPATDGAPNPPEDELPEDEELTPELVEEEAIRGDFMLRWAAIFLAVLFGFTQITDTRSLVHIRSGDAMRANGFLPPATDQLSYSLGDRSVANVSWLFDHVVSLVHSVGGDSGLTVFKALVAGIIAYLISLISVHGMPTWWSSICCALAAAACSIDFMPVTDLATLLGLSIVLIMLHRQNEGAREYSVWKLPLTIAIWANFDPRAYLGVLAVVLFSLGSHLQRSLSRKDGSPGPATSALWKSVVFCALALLLNPSPLASIKSAYTIYSVEYATMAQMNPLASSNGNALASDVLLDGRTEYFPLWTPQLFSGFEFAYVAALTLIVLAIVVLLINRRRDDLPWVVTFIGFSILAVLAVHELPAASLVAAAAAGTAAQRWYSRAFRQEYSVDPSEVLFSRGGRSVTVLAFAALAFFIVADRLPTRAPIGMGFEPDLKTTMTSLGRELAELPEGSRVLNTVVSQGDLLIWHGHRTYVDSRVTPFGRYSDDTSPIRKFDTLRWSIIQRPDAVADTTSDEDSGDFGEREKPYDAEWKSHLTGLSISHAMIRLAPPGRPAYSMVTALMQSPDWVPTHRGASAMMFALIADPQNLPKPLSSLSVAFRLNSEVEDVEQAEFGRPQDFYQKYIYANRHATVAPLREAQHYLMMDSQMPEQAVYQLAMAAASDPQNSDYMSLLGRTLAGPLMSVRRAHEALLISSQDALAHRLLGAAYARLHATENAISAAFGGSGLGYVRYMQSVMALRQSATIEPTSALTWEQLMNLYQAQGRTSLAEECLVKLLDLEEENMLKDPNAEAQLRQLYEMQRTWSDLRENVRSQVDEMLDLEMPEDPQQHVQQKMELVQQLYDQGYLTIALTVLKDNQQLLQSIPDAELLRGQILLETGELADGFKVLNQLAAVVADNPQHPGFAGIKWHTPVALSRLAKADFPGASDAWNQQLLLFANFQKAPELAKNLMQALPLVPVVDSRLGGIVSVWPLLNIQSAQVPLSVVSGTKYEPTMLRAIANLEAGNVANAKFILEGLIADGGQHALKPLAAVYFYQLSDNAAELIADTRVELWEDFTFPDESVAVPDSNETADTPKTSDVKDEATEKKD